MRKIIIPGLILYGILAGLGLFLDPKQSNLVLSLWLSGFLALSFTIIYDTVFSGQRQNNFLFIVLAVYLLNFFIQMSGGAHSPLWPVYFLFAVIIAAFSPIWQAYSTATLILAIEASNITMAGHWEPSQRHVYVGFGLSLFGLTIGASHFIHRMRRETAQVRDAHERLIAHADALDPLANTSTLESLMQRKKTVVGAAREREISFNGLIDMISRFVPAHTYSLFLRERRERGDVFILRAIRSASADAVHLIGTELPDNTYIDVCAKLCQRQYLSDISSMGTPLSNLGYYRPEAKDLAVRSFLAIPVMQDDATIGVIAVDSLDAGAFSLKDQDNLGFFESFFIQIIDKIQMSLNLKTRADHFAALHEISADLNSSLKFGEIMGRVIPRIAQLVPHDFCACVLKAEEDGVSGLQCAALAGYEEQPASRFFIVEESALIGSMIKSWREGGGTSYYSADLGDRGRDIGLFPFKELQRPIRSLYGRLLLAKDDFVGVFFLASLSPDAFSEYQREYLLDTLMNQISMVAYNSQLYQRIENLARTDGLTGLLNHRTFMEKLREEFARLDREVRPFSVLLMDIDKFKGVNDKYGHPVGDIAIKTVAKVLKQTGRASDFIARYGGEEFAVGMVDTDSKGAEQMAERIRKTVEQTLVTRVFDGELRVTVSVGVCSFPEDGTNKPDLVTMADNALYHAKRSGRNRICPFRTIKNEAPHTTK